MTTTNTARVTPGLAGLRRHPKAAATRAAVLADQRKGRKAAAAKLAGATTAKPQKRSGGSPSDRNKVAKAGPAGGKLAVLDGSRTFKGETGKCWDLVKAAVTVAAYLAAGTKAGVSPARLRFCLRHFSTTLKVVRVS